MVERAAIPAGPRMYGAALAVTLRLMGGSADPAAQGEDLGLVLDSLSTGERVRVEVAGRDARLQGRLGGRDPDALGLETSDGRRRVPIADVERLWTWDDHTLEGTLLGIGFIGGIGFALGSWMFGDPAGGALIGLPAAVAGGLAGGANGRHRSGWRLRFRVHGEGASMKVMWLP